MEKGAFSGEVNGLNLVTMLLSATLIVILAYHEPSRAYRKGPQKKRRGDRHVTVLHMHIYKPDMPGSPG